VPRTTTLSQGCGDSEDPRPPPPIGECPFPSGWDALGEGEDEPFLFSPSQLSDLAQIGVMI